MVEEHLAALTSSGAHILVARVDVTKAEQISSLLEEVERSMPPLRGIIHAAGILDDGLLLNMDQERFRRVLEPKMLGAWNLHSLTQSAPLDFFVLFSSAASLLGSPGQGNYASANAFLDALAHHRQALNMPALSINWGPWSDIGLAASSAKRGERLALMGIASLSPRQGLEALSTLLRERAPQVGVIPLNLRQWRQSYPQAAQAPFLAHLIEEQDAAPRSQVNRSASPMRNALLAAEMGQRRALLEEHLREQIGRVLRLSPASIEAHTALSALGFDSLMALELRNRLEDSLGITLPTTVAWSHPTIAALAVYLAEKMGIALESSKSRIEDMEHIQFSQREEEDIVKMLEIIKGFSSKELS
jgi:myxalamid-type polyketide synthase MxaE and MxaD